MNEKNRELLEEEIQAELEALSGMEVGSEPYKIAVDGLTKLIDRATNLRMLRTKLSKEYWIVQLRKPRITLGKNWPMLNLL